MQILIQLFWECIVFIRFYSVWEKMSQKLCSVFKNPKHNGETFYSSPVFLNFGCTLERPGKLLKTQCRPMVIFAPSHPSINQNLGGFLQCDSTIKLSEPVFYQSTSATQSLVQVLVQSAS